MKTIFITGISSGFGLLSTLELLKQRNRVLGVVRGGEERMLRLAEALPDLKHGLESGLLRVVDADLSKPESYADAAHWVDHYLGGRLDVLIHNAGFGIFGPGDKLSESEIRQQMEVNFFAPTLLTRTLIPRLEQSKGRILCVSSICGRVAVPFYANYCASKFAMEGFFESLWMDLKPKGVQVSLIEPGAFKTEFNQKLSFAAEPFPEREALRRLIVEKSKRAGSPAGRVVRVILKCCNNKRIPLRVACGLDARALLILKWLLPSRTFAFLVERVWRWALGT